MATISNQGTYPFDPTGNAATNLITGEQQIITGANFRDYHFIVPKLAPFFADSLVVTYRDTQGVVRPLVEGIDYYCTHWFIAASRACAKDIFGSISFLDTLLSGVVTLKYQTIGGIWTQDDAQIAEILANKLANPRTTSWDVIVDMVVSFPVIDHEWDLQDMVGQTEMVQALAGIEEVLRQTGETGITAHIANLDNPHQVTGAQVGLGNVRNLRTATEIEGVTGTSDALYMTPLSTFAAINNKAIAPLTAHKNDFANPHQTTAAQVGAYSKSQTDTLLLAKLGTNQAAYDTARFDGKLPIEFADWVLAQTAANSLKFNGLTAGEYRDYILEDLQTTINGYSTTQVDNLLAQKLGVLEVAADSSKLAGLTLAQVKTNVLAGTADNATKFNNLTQVQFKDYVIQQTTPALIGTLTATEINTLLGNKLDKTATAADTVLFGSMLPSEFKAYVLAGSATNATQFGGMTPDDYKTNVLTGTAANSSRFEGMTYSEVLAQLDTRYTGALEAKDGRYKTDAYKSPTAEPVLWTRLGSILSPDPAVPKINAPDLQWLVAGTDLATATDAGLYYLRCSVRTATPKLILRNLGDTQTPAQFGYTSEATSTAGVNKITIWVKTADNKNSITVTELSKGAGTVFDSSSEPVPLDDEPVGIIYVPAADQYLTVAAAETTYASQTEVNQVFDNLIQAINDLKAAIEAP